MFTWTHMRVTRGMRALGANFKAFVLDDTAPTAVEYALMLGAIVVVVATGAYALGGNVAGIFQRANSALR